MPLTILKKRTDFLQAASSGVFEKSSSLVVQLFVTDQPSRFGFTASRRFSKKAVNRNRAKRRMKAIASSISSIFTKHDWVLIARTRILTASFPHLCQETERLMKACLEKKNNGSIV